MSYQKMCVLFDANCHNYLWNKLIKKELYQNIHFKDCIALSDLQVMYKIFDKADSVYQICTPLVNYRKHAESMTAVAKNIAGYWEYRLKLFLDVSTFIFDKYDIAKFICRRTIEKELFKTKQALGKKDYNKLYEANSEKINHITKDAYNCNFDVDLVVPFVNNNDPIWQKAYIQATGKKNYLNSARFDHPDMFKYFLAGVDKFMPWIRKIHLIVSNIEQVPDYINKEKTHIVLHKDIMPEEILPTFNSSTIEMFISKIEGLSEHFIYSNDDMYPVAPLAKTDFFSEDGKPKIVFKLNYVKQQMSFFNKLCLNVYNHTAEALNIPYDNKTFLRPEHTMSSFILSHCQDCFEKMWKYIKQDLGKFRTEKQHTQYMYAYYERFINNYIFGGPAFKYYNLSNNLAKLELEIKFRRYKIICLNGVKDTAVSQENIASIKKLLESNLAADLEWAEEEI